MIDDKKQFEKFVRGLEFDDSPDPEHRDKLEQDLLAALTKQTARQTITWRTIMKSNITKLATAAAAILIAVVAITLFDKSATQVWAIEQTIEAMKRFNAIHLSGTMVMSRKSLEEGFNVEIVDSIFQDGQIPFEIWAQVNEQGTRSGSIKIEGANGMIGVADEKETTIYVPKSNTIFVQQGSHIMISPWPSYDFLTEKQKTSEDWKVLYGTDADTGRERIFATCRSAERRKSWWFEFDMETKLLVRFRQWANEYRQGDPQFDINKIVYYEELPDDMFELEAPENAKILEGFTPLIGGFAKLNDPEYGISADGLTKEEACHEILKQFWQALINDDLARVRQLLPVTADWEDEILIRNLGLNEEDDIVELLEVRQISGETTSNIGPVVVVPSIIKCKDGKRREVKMVIQFRQIDGEASCVIYANSGKAREIK